MKSRPFPLRYDRRGLALLVATALTNIVFLAVILYAALMRTLGTNMLTKLGSAGEICLGREILVVTADDMVGVLCRALLSHRLPV